MKSGFWRVFLLCVWVGGCAGTTAVIHPTAFLNQGELLSSGKNFSSEYRAGADGSHYSKVKVMPVSLDYYASADIPDKSQVQPLAEVIKKDFESELVLAGYALLFENEKPDSRTLIVEPALISVSAAYNLVYVESSALGGPLSTGSAVIEIKVKNSKNNLLAMAAEKRKSGGGGVSNGTYKTRFHHAENASKKWAKQLVGLLS